MRCTESGWVLPLLKSPTNTPEPASQSLHWTSLGSALVRSPNTYYWPHNCPCPEAGCVLPMFKPWEALLSPHFGFCTKLGWVLPLYTCLTNTPEPASVPALNWLSPALVQDHNKHSWASISVPALNQDGSRICSSPRQTILSGQLAPCPWIKVCPPLFNLPGNTAAASAAPLQSCPTPCNSIDGSPPGLPVPGILQARRLEWVAISFSNA